MQWLTASHLVSCSNLLLVASSTGTRSCKHMRFPNAVLAWLDKCSQSRGQSNILSVSWNAGPAAPSDHASAAGAATAAAAACCCLNANRMLLTKTGHLLHRKVLDVNLELDTLLPADWDHVNVVHRALPNVSGNMMLLVKVQNFQQKDLLSQR